MVGINLPGVFLTFSCVLTRAVYAVFFFIIIGNNIPIIRMLRSPGFKCGIKIGEHHSSDAPRFRNNVTARHGFLAIILLYSDLFFFAPYLELPFNWKHKSNLEGLGRRA